MQVFIGMLCAAGIAAGAYRVRALSASGGLSAWVVGSVIFGVGGWPWGAALVVFFVTSSILSRWRRHRKEALGFEKGGQRDAGQVWANGGVATFCALLPWISTLPVSQAHLLFLSAIAAATADTWATEIGAAWGDSPRDARTGRRVPPGTSGGVTIRGTAAALAGAMLLGLFAGRFWWLVAAAGFLGAWTDSVLGATLQAQWRDAQVPERWTERPPAFSAQPDRGWRVVNNDFVNWGCTLAAAFACAIEIMLWKPS